MVQSHAERRDAICDRMMTGLQSGDMHQAVEAGVVILDSFGGRFSDDPHKDVGLRLTLASLLTTNRKAPGDYSRSIRLIRDSLKDMPPQMAGSRFRVAYDLAVALCALAREGGALEPGARAVISGLNARPELNGVTGTIIAWYPDRGRYAVRVSDTEEVALRPASVGDDDDAFDDAFVARVREATRAAKAIDPDAAAKEGAEAYAGEVRELKSEALMEAYATLMGYDEVGDASLKLHDARRAAKKQNDARFAELRIEICEALCECEWEGAKVRTQSRFNLGAALCSAGRLREGRECYARALEMSGASEPSLRSEIESALRTAEAQIAGELPSGDAVLFDADGVQMVLETDERGGMRTRAL